MNSGITNIGGTITGKQIVGVGNAYLGEGMSGVFEKLDEIDAVLSKNQQSLDNIAELKETVSSIRSDLNEKNPKKEAIGTKIDKLISSASSATNLVLKLSALKTAIYAIL